LRFIKKIFFCGLFFVCCHTKAYVVPSWDIDKNGSADALTDGLIILRHLFDVSGNDLVDGVVASDSPLLEHQLLQSLYETLTVADIDNSGHVDALTDGLIILRYLFDVKGSDLINGVVYPGAKRTGHGEITSFMKMMMPGPLFLGEVEDVDGLLTGTWTSYQDKSDYEFYLNPDVYNAFSIPMNYHELFFSPFGNVTYKEYTEIYTESYTGLAILHCSGKYVLNKPLLDMNYNCKLTLIGHVGGTFSEDIAFTAEVSAIVEDDYMSNIVVTSSIENAVFDIYTLYRNDFFIVEQQTPIKPGIYGFDVDTPLMHITADGLIYQIPFSGGQNFVDCRVLGKIRTDGVSDSLNPGGLGNYPFYKGYEAILSFSNCNGSTKQDIPFIIKAGTTGLNEAVFFVGSENNVIEGESIDSTWLYFVRICRYTNDKDPTQGLVPTSYADSSGMDYACEND
jgi:hypothetical protein